MLHTNLHISEEEINNWNKFGFLLRSNHLKNTITDLNKAIKEIEGIHGDKRESLFYYEEINNKPKLCRIEKFLKDNIILHEMIIGPNILGLVSKLLAKPVFLYKEKINIKCSGGLGYSAHQDATAYHKLKGHITCLIALTEMTKENGCLYLSEFENNKTILPYDDNGCILEDREKTLTWIPMIMTPGDCLFFNSFVPHKSNTNYTDKSRKAIYLTFNDADEGDLRNNYYAERSKKLELNKDRISTIGHFLGKNYRN